MVSVTFKAYAALTYSIRNWSIPIRHNVESRLKLIDFNKVVAKKLPLNCSADAYLYWDANQLQVGVTIIESSTTRLNLEPPTSAPAPVGTFLGLEDESTTVDSIGLFETDMYMSRMHGGHGGGKTSSFKRCLFLKCIGEEKVAKILVAAVETCPPPLCYLHLLQGGGAVSDVAIDSTAFGCRDWDFVCVITGIWPRDQDGTEAARAAVRWVYNVARELLPVSTGVYGADLGPGPRDAALAGKGFWSKPAARGPSQTPLRPK